ncbi:MAG: flagellin [Lachnospiraceae bacterium]|nr:flagellin [Lachnospiraceae bacterium]
MVVQHNMQAMNANRMLGVTTSAQGKSTEKLSSGYKINRAADDAAGLSISEKMRKQINGLDRASTNAQDGISAVQTAEGALTEVHAMLQRMNELAVQAANGTNSESDRTALQNEIDQLTTEIDRVAETTKFNETYLLKGDVAGTTKSVTLEGHDAGLKGKFAESATTAGEYFFTADTLAVGDKVNIGGVEYSIVTTTDNNSNSLSTTDAYGKMAEELAKANGVGATANPTINHAEGATLFTFTAKTVTVAKALTFNLHVGADADMTNKIGVNIETMNAAYLGVKDLDVVGPANDNGITATYAIDAIADAVQKVSDQRSALGAIQNRLEHTIANVDNVVENTTAAESRIRDTDMASEMVTYSKNNILAQAGQSMLAQANQSTQGVMSLLG